MLPHRLWAHLLFHSKPRHNGASLTVLSPWDSLKTLSFSATAQEHDLVCCSRTPSVLISIIFFFSSPLYSLFAFHCNFLFHSLPKPEFDAQTVIASNSTFHKVEMIRRMGKSFRAMSSIKLPSQ